MLHALLLATLLSMAPSQFSHALLNPPPPNGLYSDPPAETNISRAVRPQQTPILQGRVFYDENASGDMGQPSCDRGVRDIEIQLYQDSDANGVFSPRIDALVAVTTTNMIGDYKFTASRTQGKHFVVLNTEDAHLPASSFNTTPSNIPIEISTDKAQVVNFGVHTRQLASPLAVVFGEIAWMGTNFSKTPDGTTDEWIELWNTTTREIDLQGWVLRALDGDPVISLGGKIPAQGRYLLRRTTAQISKGPQPDQEYSGTLGNSSEHLQLQDGKNVIDEVGAWYAGNSTTKQTMERLDTKLIGTKRAAWHDGEVNGTPQNSAADNDHDGYFFSPNFRPLPKADCDDAAAISYPGAKELLDMKDNDCNGQIDDELTLPAAQISFFRNDIITATGPVSCVLPMDDALVKRLDQAQHTIDAAIYGFDRADLRDALIRAHQRGVRVRVVGDDDAYLSNSYGTYYRALEAVGIPVTYDMRGDASIEHNKFVVIDGQTVWTGSMNWTDNDVTYNANNSLAIESPHLAQAYTTEFEEMFDPLMGKNGLCKSDNTTHVFNFAGQTVKSYFSPSDDVEGAILNELSNAKESIHLAMFFLTSNKIGDLLIQKATQENVDVKIVLDAVGAANTYALDKRLCDAKIAVKVETFGGKVHDKFAVIDSEGEDPRVITGSYNWTSSANSGNDENSLIIHDRTLAQNYQTEFHNLYDALPTNTLCATCSAETGPYACYDGLDNDFDGRVDQFDPDCTNNMCNQLQPLEGILFNDKDIDSRFSSADSPLANVSVLVNRQLDRRCEGLVWKQVKSASSTSSGYSVLLQAGQYQVGANVNDSDLQPGGAVATTNWLTPVTIEPLVSTTRNVGLLTCPADVNRDGEVTVDDVQRVSAQKGAVRGSATYDAFTDVNKDGSIDSNDMDAVVQTWGTRCKIKP